MLWVYAVACVLAALILMSASAACWPSDSDLPTALGVVLWFLGACFLLFALALFTEIVNPAII